LTADRLLKQVKTIETLLEKLK